MKDSIVQAIIPTLGTRSETSHSWTKKKNYHAVNNRISKEDPKTTDSLQSQTK